MMQPLIVADDAPLGLMIGDVIRDYRDLIDAARMRAEALGATRLQIDSVSGMPEGYASKLLARNPLRSFGPVSFGPVMASLGMKLIAVEDMEAFERVRTAYGRRRRDVIENGLSCPCIGE